MNDESLSAIKDLLTNENIIMLILAIVAISVVVSIIRSVMRLAMPLVVIGLVMVVFLGYTPDSVLNFGKKIVTYGSSLIQNNIPFIENQNLKKQEQTDNKEVPIFQRQKVEERLNSFLNKDKEESVDQMFDQTIENNF